MAADEQAAATRPSCRPQEQWRPALGSLQRNCLQFGANLARLQQVVGSQLQQLARPQHLQPQPAPVPALLAAASLSQAAAPAAAWSSSGSAKAGSSGAVSKEEIGRATWTFLHTLAAQYPEKPTRQQQRDARNLIDILTRMYPCAECAAHFRELVRQSPPSVACRRDFSRWMCEAHNTVNRRLGKPTFNCALAEARWAGVECEGDGADGRSACSLEVGRRR